MDGAERTQVFDGRAVFLDVIVRRALRSETRHLESDCGMQEADSYADQVAISSRLDPLRIVVDLEGIL